MSSLLHKDATEMEPCKIGGTTQPLVSRTGAGRQGNIFSFRSREKNVLDFSSYRSGFVQIAVSTMLRPNFLASLYLSICGALSIQHWGFHNN
jgi:hypothetical protein